MNFAHRLCGSYHLKYDETVYTIQESGMTLISPTQKIPNKVPNKDLFGIFLHHEWLFAQKACIFAIVAYQRNRHKLLCKILN